MNVVHLNKYITMKIYDIISEQQVQEGLKDKALAWVLRKAGGLIGRGNLWRSAEEIAPSLAKEMERVGRKLTPEELKDFIKMQHPSKEIEDALEVAARSTRTGRLTSAERKAVLDRFPDPEPALLKKAEKKASDLADEAAVAKAKTAFTGPAAALGTGVKVASGSIDLLLAGWQVYEFYQPWSEFKENMANAEKWMQVPKAEGGWGEAEYKYALNKQVSILIGRWATLIIGGAIAKVIPNKIVAYFEKQGLKGTECWPCPARPAPNP